MPRSIDDLATQADELADEFEGYEPSEDARGEPALLALRRAAYRRALVERDLVERVRQARQAGASWSKIGSELGTSGEAARQRYGDKVAVEPPASKVTPGREQPARTPVGGGSPPSR